MRDLLITERAEEIRRIAREHGARRVRVFGSRARGEASESSDLDLLVDLEPGRDLLDLVALKQDIEGLLGCRVDVVEEPSIDAARVWFCSDEHVTFAADDQDSSPRALRVGDRIRVWPAHVDPTVAYHAAIRVVRGDDVIDTWPVDLRGW